MLWTWLCHEKPQMICGDLLHAAVPRTTALSRAFLRAAANGDCSAPWHRFLSALQKDAKEELERAVREVLSHGQSSGADTLAGFLHELGP